MARVAITSGSNLEISTDHEGKDTVVRLKGRIDVDSSPDIRDYLLAIFSGAQSPDAVMVDLAGVTSIEASGIATLIEALKVARHHSIRFQLRGLDGSVLQLFEATGLLALFDIGSGETGVS